MWGECNVASVNKCSEFEGYFNIAVVITDKHLTTHFDEQGDKQEIERDR